MARLGYYPEMGDNKPTNVDGTCSLAHYGEHYFIDTKLDLKGRGINYLKTLTAEELTPRAQEKVGYHVYKVTLLAFEKLTTKYNFSNELLLD